MNTNQSSNLGSESRHEPEEAQILTKRERVRTHVANHRARAAEAGLVQLVVMIPKASAEKINAFKRMRGYRNKSDALALILDELPGVDPDKVRISISPQSAKLLDEIAVANGLRNRSQAAELILLDTSVAKRAARRQVP